MNVSRWAITATTAIFVSTSACAFASEMVYHPVNPTFGGNPLNGSFLLSTAQGQGEGTKSGQQSPDLSGLDSALSNIGNGGFVVSPTSGSNGSGGGNSGSGSTNNGSGGNSSGSGTSSSTNSAFRAARIAQPSGTTTTQTGFSSVVP